MRKIALGLLLFTLAAGGVPAQDTATQQALDKLAGQLQDFTERLAAQDKRLETLEHQVSELRDKVNTPVVNNSASADDLQKLATQVKEIDQKRQADKEFIIGKIEDLGKITAAPPVRPHHVTGEPKDPAMDPPPAVGGVQKETTYPYKIQAGDNLTAIIKAFRDKGVKVTQSQVLKANPGLTPDTLIVGKTIYIPDPAAK
jgi:hypothetical protein